VGTGLYIGPINTMLLNGREVGRAIMCSFDLAFNQTKTYMSLRLVPVIDILFQLQVFTSIIVTFVNRYVVISISAKMHRLRNVHFCE